MSERGCMMATAPVEAVAAELSLTTLSAQEPPFETAHLRAELTKFLNQNYPLPDGSAMRLGSVKWGVYAFYDYDDEPPDLRIARRSATLARLAQVISERKVQQGLRRALLVQARRLEALAGQRYQHAADTGDDEDG
jgi:hypothetical protein